MSNTNADANALLVEVLLRMQTELAAANQEVGALRERLTNSCATNNKEPLLQRIDELTEELLEAKSQLRNATRPVGVSLAQLREMLKAFEAGEQSQGKIDFIKEVRSAAGVSLREAKDFSEEFKRFIPVERGGAYDPKW